jgi:transposase
LYAHLAPSEVVEMIFTRIETPTREQLVRLDRKRKKRMSNEERKSRSDGDARIAKMKDGRTHSAHHSGAVVERVKSYEVRSYIPEKKQKGRRHWAGKTEQQQALYQNRQRVRGEYGKSLLRRRGELVERSFAHCYDTGGMRRTHLRGHPNILKRQLIHVGAFNLSLILRKLMGAGTPREWRNRGGVLFLLLYFLQPRREGRNRPCRSGISMFRAKYLTSSRNRVRCWPCRNSATYTTGC